MAAPAATTAAIADPLPAVVVTGNPLGSSLLELVPPVSVLQGNALSLQLGSTLGATLANVPGVSGTDFGPQVSRPIIRGLDADRIRILQNGGASLDASSLSFDHAVPIDPLVAERIEVVRGPAALLYGGSAMGGVVNVIDNRIPKEAVDGVSGKFEGRIGGAENERSAGVLLEAGNGQIAIHADANSRKTSDLRIPDFARSDRLRASDPLPVGELEQKDHLANSDGQQEGGALGVSLTGDHGYVGVSASGYHNEYGSVAEDAVRIRMRQNRLALEGEARDLADRTGGWIESVKGKFSFSDYEHREFENDVVGTTFTNRGSEARLEAKHARLGSFDGVFGLQLSENRFAALGDEAFVPSTHTQHAALFVFEETPVGGGNSPLKVNAGGRVEYSRIEAKAGGNARFADDQQDFTAGSASLGLLYKLDQRFSLTASSAYTERAPTFYELYANGPHVATGAFEVGSRTLEKEKATSFELGLRYKEAAHRASITAYTSRFSNYIALYDTGRWRDGDGNVLAAGSADALPELAFQPVAARFYGVEAEASFRLAEKWWGSDALDLEMRGDWVRAKNLDTDEALPRIAPLHLGGALAYQRGPWGARVEVTFAAKQSQVPAGERATDSYTTVGLALTYAFKLDGTSGLIFLKGENLSNAEIRSASSILRDIAPQGGRAVRAGLRLAF